MSAFHDVRFPEKISYGAAGGPGFKTSIFTRASGAEDRNIEWQYAKAEYDVAHTIKKQEELDEVRSFFFARRGMAYAFRFKDWSDYKSCSVVRQHQATDQVIATGDGVVTEFQLTKTYPDDLNSYTRIIRRPVLDSVLVAVDGVSLTRDVEFTVDATTGGIMFGAEFIPEVGAIITAGYHFDVPVRFGTDRMMPTLEDYNVSTWGQIPLVEVR